MPTAATARQRWTAALVLAGTALVTLQGGLLRVAYPVIRADLDVSIVAMEVVGIAGLVTTIATVVIFGRLADLVGARRVYAAGLFVFAAGGVSSAAAPRVGLLAVAQAAQGVGWAMTVASSTKLLVEEFPTERRGRVVAANHMAVAVGLGAGPGLGGVVVEHLGWRTGFLSVVPAAVVVGALVLRRLPVDAPSGPRPHLDLAGATTLAVALAALLVFVDRAGHGELDGPTLTAVVLLATVAFATFLVTEVAAPEPTVDLRLFRSLPFSAGLGASFLNFVAMASNMFLMPFFLQEALGLSAGRAGAVMIWMPVGVLATAPLAGRLADRVGSRLPATLGMALITATVALMASFTGGVTQPEVAAVLFAYGVGAGLFQSPNTSGVLGATPAGRLGVASGTLSTVGRLGQVVGIAVAGGLLGAATAPSAGDFRRPFAVLALVGVLATAVSWLRGPAPSGPPRPSPAPFAG